MFNELSKELSKGLSETAANIYKMIYADNYITRGEIANRIGISLTAFYVINLTAKENNRTFLTEVNKIYQELERA